MASKAFERFWNAATTVTVVYDYMSDKHLDRYVKEFSFPHNTSQARTMPCINRTIDRMAFKRLTYKELVGA